MATATEIHDAKRLRLKQVLELRAQGLTYSAIGEIMGTMRHEGALSCERVRQMFVQGRRILRHPTRTEALRLYEETGVVTWEIDALRRSIENSGRPQHQDNEQHHHKGRQ